VWYTKEDWSNFVDWMALSGINLALALTGQEEVQYKVYRQLGLSDQEIRTWFNGPAFLAWSRGQNEYGNNIAGPLPRSWMKAQWELQKFILSRYRSLGIVGQLPGFQGNIPWPLAAILNDTSITQQGDTGWMDSLDPEFGKIADLWMKTLINDFGTDNWYQLDGYFNGGTAPWIDADIDIKEKIVRKQLEDKEMEDSKKSHSIEHEARESDFLKIEKVRAQLPKNNFKARNKLPPCTWSTASDSYLAGCFRNCEQYPTIDAAKAECEKHVGCGGVTVSGGLPQLRQGIHPRASPSNETTYYITNGLECHNLLPDPLWRARGAAAYAGLSRSDPKAIWSFQGWAIIDWESALTATYFMGFVDSVPKGNFVIIDMSVNGAGEWKKFNNAAFFGAPFIWTTLHDFGGTDGMKGDLRVINRIPFDALNESVLGSGYTPEGIDQNPVYYEFMAEANFRLNPVADIPKHIVLRSHRRYGLVHEVSEVTKAWQQLVDSTYSQDLSVQDGTGIPHLPGYDTTQFYPNRVTPKPKLCLTFFAWQNLLSAEKHVNATLEPFRYDLVNVGREVLAQLSTPMSNNFTDAMKQPKLDSTLIKSTGELYIELLKDVDMLVATDSAFLLGPWIEAARRWGVGYNDCGEKACPDFYEWNARVQLTTWNPTPKGATKIPDGPVDYASKHWSGLIKDYYATRAEGILKIALENAVSGKPLDQNQVNQFKANLAYTWTNSNSQYPIKPVGDAVEVSKALLSKYSKYFSQCH
jgi:hypothetical protein